METVVLVLGHAELQKNLIPNDSFIVGVDGGALICVKHQLIMDLAIGDFDSVSKQELTDIQTMSKKIIVLEKEKDDSDFEAALRYFESSDRILVFGFWGKRLDHSYVNLQLLKQNSKIEFVDSHNYVFTLKKGSFKISKGNYTYLSVFALEDSVISLQGVKYPLNKQFLKVVDLYTLSNEIIDEEALIVIDSGYLLIIQSKD